MDVSLQCDTSTHCNFDQPMAVTFFLILISIFVVFFALKETSMSLVAFKGTVLDPGKGVSADPRGGDATLGVGGPGPPMGDNERQLNLDRGGEKT